MNYGHSLQFGTFITPRNTAPEQVVALATYSEELGYDLVSFQDHPYQAAFLDTWTLLTWVAAQTQTIQIAPNVINLPLRPPAMLARSAASLDLLSGGRVNLGLGAGAFWDGIVAMGGKRLSAGEAVAALSEGMDVIRGLMDISAGRSFSFKGEYYQVSGAHRGPLPAHAIPIWLGAYKPRMLALVGQKADGWLPSLSYLKDGDIKAGNKAIDDAATEAGRDPREIRRLLNINGQFSSSRGGFLNGTSQDWVEDLLPLVVEDGIGTLILAADDGRMMQHFAEEVIPALREAVNHALPSLASESAIRPVAVRSKRHDGIDYDSVPESLAKAVIEPGDIHYARVRSTYMRGGSPAIVFQVETPAQIVDALAFARRYPDLPLGIRSGGHGISGRSTNRGGIVIDVSRFNKIDILDASTRRVRIEPGATWGDVAHALAPHGWALSSGDYGGVGVGGLATAGGVGWLVRQHGLTIDHVRAVEMILADGTQIRADDTQNTDLFWAVRGAGANFGIVTAFEFEVDEVGNIGYGQFVMDANNTAGFLQQWGQLIESAPRDLTSFLMMGAPRPGQGMVAQVMSVVNSDEPDIIIDRLQPIANLAPVYDQQVVITPYVGLMAHNQEGYHSGQGEPVGRSGLVKHITPEFAADIERLMFSGNVYFFQIRVVGGAVADVPSDATAYGYRAANFSVTAFGTNRERMNQEWDKLAHHFEGMYLNFDTDLRPHRIHDAFPPATLTRLRTLKAQYDPHNVFKDNFNITPEATED